MKRAKNLRVLLRVKSVPPVVLLPARTMAPVAEKAGTAVARVLPSKAVQKNVDLPLAVKKCIIDE